MSVVEPTAKRDCRCSSCGYVHISEKVDPITHVPEHPVAPPTVPVVVPTLAVVQLAVCPLCRTEYTDPAEYAAHRERNCEPAPIETDPAPVDPLTPEPAPAPPEA